MCTLHVGVCPQKCNQLLGDHIKENETTGKMSRKTPASYKKEYDFLKEVDSLALCNAQLHEETAFKNFFRDKKVGFPKYTLCAPEGEKKHKAKKSYTTNVVNGNIFLVEGFLRFPKVGMVRIKCHRNIPKDYTLKSEAPHFYVCFHIRGGARHIEIHI